MMSERNLGATIYWPTALKITHLTASPLHHPQPLRGPPKLLIGSNFLRDAPRRGTAYGMLPDQRSEPYETSLTLGYVFSDLYGMLNPSGWWQSAYGSPESGETCPSI